MSKENFVRYTLDNLPAGRIDRARVLGTTDEEIEAMAAADPDNPLATDEELAAGRLVLPADRASAGPFLSSIRRSGSRPGAKAHDKEQTPEE